MARRTPRPEDLRPGALYSRAVLFARGVHPRILASAKIDMPLPGCCTRSDAPASLAKVARVLQTEIRPGAVISHVTAGELLGLPVPRSRQWREGEPLHCRAAKTVARSVTRRIVVHPERAAPRVTVCDVVVSDLVATLQDLACSLELEDLVACVDAAVGGKARVSMPLAELRRRTRVLEGYGAPALRDAVSLAQENVWSPMETRTRLLLSRQGFPLPVANLRVDDPDTEWFGFIDLAYPQWKIAIEYDSEEHRLDRRRWQRDLHKNEVLHRLGWTVLRISIADLAVPDQFLRRLGAAVNRAEAA